MKEIDNVYIVYLDKESIAGIDYLKEKADLDNMNEVIKVLLSVYENTTHDNELAKILGDRHADD